MGITSAGRPAVIETTNQLWVSDAGWQRIALGGSQRL